MKKKQIFFNKTNLLNILNMIPARGPQTYLWQLMTGKPSRRNAILRKASATTRNPEIQAIGCVAVWLCGRG